MGCDHMFQCGSVGPGPELFCGSHLQLGRKPRWKNPERFFPRSYRRGNTRDLLVVKIAAMFVYDVSVTQRKFLC